MDKIEKQERIGDWVLCKNNQFIAFNKPPGIPVQEDKTGDKSLIQLAEIFSKAWLYPVHRLDRPASGIVLFGKTRTAVRSLNEQFRRRTIRKTYLAVVKHPPPNKEGTLRHFLTKNPRANRSAVVEETEGSQLSELKYHLRGSSDNYHLLEIELLTGRHHQIRTQLAAIGCPVKGDVKYGARRSNPNRSIHLHAWKLAFRHPVSNEEVLLVAALPPDPVWDAFQSIIANDAGEDKNSNKSAS